MDRFAEIIAAISAWIWGPPLLILLSGTHLYLTFRLGFIQRYLWKGIKLSVRGDLNSPGDISQFGALAVALASTIGAGNIVGVATAIAAGGPGAVFWLWLTGVFGMATKYAEAVLAIHYRVKRDSGEYAGGPMYVLDRALGQKWLARLFCIFTIFAGLGMANMVQSNTLITMTQANFPTANPSTIAIVGGLLLTAGVAAILMGGIRSISRVSTFLVPAMGILYFVVCGVELFRHFDRLPATLNTILTTAFTGQAAIGGFAGATMAAAMRFGIARGLFSNESGLGSAPIAAAAAKTANSVRQGLVSATGTFWDTVIGCAITGLVVVNSGAWESGLQGSALVHLAFSEGGTWVLWGLNLSLALFVFTAIYGWAYYPEKAVEYLVGPKGILPFRIIWCAGVFVGAVSSTKMLWDFADIANALMAIPNLVTLLALTHIVRQETKTHLPHIT